MTPSTVNALIELRNWLFHNMWSYRRWGYIPERPVPARVARHLNEFAQPMKFDCASWN